MTVLSWSLSEESEGEERKMADDEGKMEGHWKLSGKCRRDTS